MSPRPFARRFDEEVDRSPGRRPVRQRVARARQLPASTDLAVDAVASRAGFTAGTSPRRHLHAAIGLSPLAYRRTFRGEAALPQPGR
ncbi:helix-turn-helix domain-containing protein [Streptomyces sp. TLI_105]|uniref:helix-turn-helix domain-containing protein n=1 Tax=Streptomyces sp. TLI_105 TaxID=1881019 RepID=UPI000B80933B